MKYQNIQNEVIKNFNITIDEDSKCWQRMHAHCRDGSRKVCKWKQQESYQATFSLLHEIGHIETDKSGMKRAEQESEATRWAILKIKEYGLPVKRKVVEKYKSYIRMTYERGIRRGLSKRIKSKLLM